MWDLMLDLLLRVLSLCTSMCVTGMTSTGSEKRLPFPGREGEETVHRGEGMQLHTGDQSRSFTEDACSLF